MQWDVPLDDEHVSGVSPTPVTAIRGSRATIPRAPAASAAEPKLSVAQMGEAVLSGKLSFQDLDDFFKDKISLVHTQDYVAQVGQGPIADRAQEHLGRSDIGIILFRRIWERELRALAEGRPLKKWCCPKTPRSSSRRSP